MLERTNQSIHRLLAFLLAVLVTVGTVFSGDMTVHAADGTVSFHAGANIPYGDYFTSRMTFDGNNTAYCVEPLKKTPASGSYSYDLLAKDSPLRKALYYLNGGYGYEKTVKDKYFSGWSDDNSYVIGHLVVAYIYAGYSSDTGAFHGAPQSFIDKAKEVAQAIKSLPAPPENFRAFIIPGSGSQTVVGSWYQVPYGYLEIRKSSANASVSDGNSNYSLQGAEYGIYKGEELVQTLTTDKNGYAKSGELEEGNYTIKETKASKGFILDTKAHNVTVKSEAIMPVNVTEIPQSNPMDLLLQKLDKESQEAQPQGSASLADAQFTVKFYTEQSDQDPATNGANPARTWIFKTDAEGKSHFTKDYMVSGDAFYTQTDGKTICLPLGTVTVQETKAPVGYFSNDTVFVQKITADGVKETVQCYNTSSVEEQIYRGDLELVKVSDGEQTRLSDVPFTITSVTTGESHTIVTDKNGYASTASKWNKHTQNTNRGETSEDGVWFGSSTPDDSKGALIYDQYVIEEQRCESNKGMNLLKFEVTVYKDSVTIDLGTLTDDLIEIGTTALDKETGTHMSKPEKEVTLVDTVEYSGLKKGQSYKLVGTLMDAETGEAIQIDGKPVTSEKTFTAKKSSGTVEVSFTFDASSLSGKTTVVFEELYQKDKQLAVHADLSDEDQQISFPEIGTQATDSETGEHMANADEKVKLIDTIQYKGLVPNLKYTATGTLMDAKTGEPVLINDKRVTAKTTFTPETSSGTVDVVFEFDGSSLAGKTTVVFESVTQDKKEIAVHADLEDEGQQIFFPEIATQANCPDTNTQMAVPKKELTITDTVSYHLIPNKEYKLTGTLMDKKSGKPLQIDGKEITSELTFTPEDAEGTVELSFTLDATALAGKTIVAFESVSYQDKEVAFHTQIDDDPQTIYFPEIKTTAKDGKDGDQEVLAEKETSIIDTVSYKDLVTGLTYRVVGTLMDKETGKEVLIAGKPVTSEATFKPENSEGTVEVTFTFDATSLSGHDVVVFEKLYVSTGAKDNKNEVELTNHEDINDNGQTVKITDVPKDTPDISTPVKTGDDTPLLLYAGIAAGALLLAGIATVIYFRKKKQK
ncbi:VaFE repeat-containing surface-anchored protein [Oliverpabstia intestinalis]|uniref:VaFE repeat-containing surface-anchored protein n=1 Tax=Oliverpabstia intestinalis TaxID=2606633 RepID=UPI003F985DA9